MSIIKKQMFLVLIVFTASLFGNPINAEINFFRMFLKAAEAKPLPQYYLLAQYQSDEGALFLAVHDKNKSYVLLEMDRAINLGSMTVTAKEFNGNQLMLESEDGSTYFLGFSDRATNKPISFNITSQSDDPVVGRMAFSTEHDPLKVFKDIANFLGLPKFITAQFTNPPKQVRTNSGRPGWVLDETIPSILLMTSPFKVNDIIVTIDGLATNDVNKLKQHLTEKSNIDYFDVEIQRDGNLKMIRVRL
jgi:hypothetical protein